MILVATQKDVVQKFFAELVGTKSSGKAAVDAAVKACSNFKSTQAVIEKILADCKTLGANNFLLEKCGINLYNRDTGAITGSDAGGSTVKTIESIVPESGALKNFGNTSFTKNGLTFTLEENLANDDEKFVWKALNTWWAEKILNLLNESYGCSFTDSDVYFKNVTVAFAYEPSNSQLAWNHWYDNKNGKADGKVDKLTLVVNMSKFKDISQTNPNGYSSSCDFYLDKTLAHELTHTIMHAKIFSSYDLPSFIQEGVAELTVGIDDEREDLITAFAEDPTLLEKWLDVSETNSSNRYTCTAGYIFMRYLAKQAATQGKTLSNSTASKTVSGSAYEDVLKNSASKVTISGGKSNDYIYNSGGSNVSINGGAGADQIFVRGNKTTVITGAGNDFVYLYSNATNTKVNASSGDNEIYSMAQKATITAGGGKDYIELYKSSSGNKVNAGGGNDSIYSSGSSATISAGAGNDYLYLYSSASGNVIEYSSGGGKDSIVGFDANDTLKIIDASFSTTTSGSDLKVNVDSGSVLLKGAKNISPTIILSMTDAGKSSMTIGSDVEIVDASARTTAVLVKGNDLANKIAGGKGNDTLRGFDGNDSLTGGAGKDKLYGGSGIDTLRGGSGNDSLWGDAGNDILYGDAGNDRLDGETGNDKIHGGAGKDTLYCGAGNDSLWGDADADKFYYYKGDGKDVIFGFGSDDTLMLDNLTFTSSYKNDVLTLTVDGGSITFKDFDTKIFHINSTTYKLSGSKLK